MLLLLCLKRAGSEFRIRLTPREFLQASLSSTPAEMSQVRAFSVREREREPLPVFEYGPMSVSVGPLTSESLMEQ